MNELSGKKALVTGSGKGIGRGIALALARAGAELFLHYRSDDSEAESLASEILALGGQARLFRADLARMSELDAMFEQIRQVWGRLDIAVNNAGWDPGPIPPEEITPELYEKLSSMNIRGTLFCSLRELEIMKQYHSGCIINLGSVQMNTTVPGRILYAASKGAIHSMSGALALEAGPLGIRVNTIAPGYVEVERMSRVPGFNREEIASGIPVRRLGTPDDIGELAVFLASEKAGFISGETIVIDGGVNRKLARSAR